jgi:reductive dehalogenase
MSAVTTSTAHFLTDLGWRAEPSGNDTALSVPLAIDAGLGELGRNGLLITRQLGPQVRLGKVFTDAPLVPDAAITFGVRTYCELCGTCARECPSGAISRDEPTWAGPTRANNPGALKWYINPGKCWAYLRANGMSCARCVHGCLFNKPAG